MNNEYNASCLCGGVSFTVTGFGDQVANCHCTMCRKFHGSAYGTLVSVTGLTWLSGIDLLQDYIAANGSIRTFCKQCGSSIGFRVKASMPENIEIAIGTFNDVIPVTADAQIFTDYKANWSTLQDGLTTFKEERGGD